MITQLWFACDISRNFDVINNATKLILPGVGSFDNGVKGLINCNLVDILNHKVLVNQTPVLGICLGMQLMAECSEECNAKGLGWIPINVKRIDTVVNQQNTIPVIGWNYIQIVKNNKLFQDNYQRFYFVHSYYFTRETPGVIATANIGFDFCAAFQINNIFGVQFHPEKSHKFGKALLTNFCNL